MEMLRERGFTVIHHSSGSQIHPRNRRPGLITLLAIATGLGATSTLMTGCARQGFVVTASVEQQIAPGSFFIPPKVDLLLAEDDTGSIYEAYPTISTQMPKFLQGLQDKGWDYHFTAIPLTTDRDLREVTASIHDPNWGSMWSPPYPGAKKEELDGIHPDFFVFPHLFTGFIQRQDVNNGLGGQEPGLENISTAFETRLPATGFLRDDALLAVVVVGNGEDTSGVNYCPRGWADTYSERNEIFWPCEESHQWYTDGTGKRQSKSYPLCRTLTEARQGGCGSRALTLDLYKNGLRQLKSDPKMIQFHAAVSTQARSGCLGGNAYRGNRYMQMAAAFSGRTFDVCSTPITSILDSLTESLQSQRLAFKTRFLVLSQEPDETTIEVTKYVHGDKNQPVSIPQSETNGWTYVGYLTDIATIDEPIEMNKASGYMILLNGSAKLTGDDTARVVFKPYGAADTE